MRIILTAVGCPGSSTMIRMLKKNGVEIHGTDMDRDVVGRWLCDSFHQVPSGGSDDFIPEMIDLARSLDVDAILPESSNEVMSLALHKEEFPCPVLVSDPDPLDLALDKAQMYRSLELGNWGNMLPGWRIAGNFEELERHVGDIGIESGHPVVIKPAVGKGSRGVRIIDPSLDPYEDFLASKPDKKRVSPGMFYSIFDGRDPKEPFDIPMIAMEYLGEKQRTVDAVCEDGEILISSVKTVERARWGVVVLSTLVDDPDLTAQADEILRRIRLSWCVNIQFIGRRLIEINPRVSSFIHQKEVCFPYLALRHACGMSVDWRNSRSKLKIGRRMVRYMDQVFE